MYSFVYWNVPRSFAIPIRHAVFVVKSRIVSVTDHLGLALLVRTSSKAISKLHSGDILPYDATMLDRRVV